MKFFRFSTLAFACLSAPHGASLVEAEFGAFSTRSSATIEGASNPEDAGWVSRRQASRTHLRELVGDEVMRELVGDDEEAASSFPLGAVKPKTSRARNASPTPRPLESHPRPKLELGRGRSRRPARVVPAALPDRNVAAERIANQTKLADELSLWRRMQKEISSSKPAAAPDVHVRRVAKSRTPLADRFRNRRLADQKAQEKVDGVKVKVTEVKVLDVKVKEEHPKAQEEPVALPKEEKVDGVKVKLKEVKVLDVKVKEEQPKEKVKEVKVRGVEAKEAQPDSDWSAEAMQTQNNTVTPATATQPVAPSTVLSCVCGGKYAKGDRIEYTGHAFPSGRTVGTILAGTRNGYLNIEWDHFHDGHTGNCQLSSCGGCEKSAVGSRWFTACSDVKLPEA